MYKIVTYPNPILRKKSEEIAGITEDIKRFVSDMARMMYKYDGIGLAAPQIGVNKRVIVIDPGKGLLKMINPRILERNGKPVEDEEGCLSFPGIYVNVARPVESIVVSAIDVNGEERVWKGSGLFARVVQHEIDHLDGRLIIDYADRNKMSKQSLAQLSKLEKDYA